MATLNETILNAALEDGLLTAKLTDNQQLYIAASVIQTNQILAILKAKQELSLEEFLIEIPLNRNTLLQYLRYL